MVALAFLQQSTQAEGWLLILGMVLLCSAESLGWHWAYTPWLWWGITECLQDQSLFIWGQSYLRVQKAPEKVFAVTFLKYCKNPVTHWLVRCTCVISERIHFSLTGTFTAHKNRTSELWRALWMVWVCDMSVLQQRWKGAQGLERHGAHGLVHHISKQNQTNNHWKCRQRKSTWTHFDTHCLWIKLMLNNRNTVFLFIYFSPGNSVAKFCLTSSQSWFYPRTEPPRLIFQGALMDFCGIFYISDASKRLRSHFEPR